MEVGERELLVFSWRKHLSSLQRVSLSGISYLFALYYFSGFQFNFVIAAFYPFADSSKILYHL